MWCFVSADRHFESGWAFHNLCRFCLKLGTSSQPKHAVYHNICTLVPPWPAFLGLSLVLQTALLTLKVSWQLLFLRSLLVLVCLPSGFSSAAHLFLCWPAVTLWISSGCSLSLWTILFMLHHPCILARVRSRTISSSRTQNLHGSESWCCLMLECFLLKRSALQACLLIVRCYQGKALYSNAINWYCVIRIPLINCYQEKANQHNNYQIIYCKNSVDNCNLVRTLYHNYQLIGEIS